MDFNQTGTTAAVVRTESGICSGATGVLRCRSGVRCGFQASSQPKIDVLYLSLLAATSST